MKMRIWILVMCLGVMNSIFHLPRAVAQTNPVVLSTCHESSPKYCIKAIHVSSVIMGLSVEAKPTGRVSSVDKITNGGLHEVGSTPEYRAVGVFNEGITNDRFLPYISYNPAVTEKCVVKYCSPAREVLYLNIKPSDFDQPWENRLVTSPNRTNNKFCGDSATPSLCPRDLKFADDIQFQITLQVSNDFELSLIHGSASNFSFIESRQTNSGVHDLLLKFSPVNHSGILTYPNYAINIKGEQIADYTINTVNLWLFGINDPLVGGMGKCAGIGAFGEVNNAVDMQAPSWNQEDQSLSVYLKAPHLNDDGTLQVGKFEAFVSFKVAKCLWGLDLSNKVEASIRATYADGNSEQIVATVSNTENEIYFLRVSGFHYSAPTIHIRLIDPDLSAPVTNPNLTLTPSPSASNTSALPTPADSPHSTPRAKLAAKKITIECSNGKLIKKIFAVKPVCPKGYKKK